MRLQDPNNVHDCEAIKSFFEWIATTGDGVAGEANDGCASIKIPEDLLPHSSGDPIATIVQSTYPQYPHISDDFSYFRDRAILAPTLSVVDEINDYMISLNTSQPSRTYLSADSVCKSDSNVNLLADLHTPEFLNKIRISGVSNHELTLKVGIPVMLLRNIDHSMGLCNGTRLIITRLGDHIY
ncbi:unnamed protein product [Cuscuta epithymum]|uniref:DNA helicase Pif1-like 2B domain-containing protein n=1 Tax=Cuscuta epithymum TaxID=186058 RepID=A0AAV0E596_9ASTE|nr:unnamed protein product [Cuscuta epithymum]